MRASGWGNSQEADPEGMMDGGESLEARRDQEHRVGARTGVERCTL